MCVQIYKNESKSQLKRYYSQLTLCCFQWFKDTKMKANHNKKSKTKQKRRAVSNGSKILNIDIRVGGNKSFLPTFIF